jgi:hypothetical protein
LSITAKMADAVVKCINWTWDILLQVRFFKCNQPDCSQFLNQINKRQTPPLAMVACR